MQKYASCFGWSLLFAHKLQQYLWKESHEARNCWESGIVSLEGCIIFLVSFEWWGGVTGGGVSDVTRYQIIERLKMLKPKPLSNCQYDRGEGRRGAFSHSLSVRLFVLFEYLSVLSVSLSACLLCELFVCLAVCLCCICMSIVVICLCCLSCLAV